MVNWDRQRLPAVSADQMRQLDQLAVDKYQVELIQMMENAGRGCAELARRECLGGFVEGQHILILAGPGGNGGGGLVAARRLHNWGAQVILKLATPVEQLSTVTRHQLDALHAVGIGPFTARHSWPTTTELVIDALLGYSLQGAPRPPFDEFIRRANNYAAPILALDLPSGLDPDSGKAHQPAIRASKTLTLALPKIGLLQPKAADYVGDLWLADVSLPPAVLKELDLRVPPNLFAHSDLVRLN